jgi:hypothetical protein
MDATVQDQMGRTCVSHRGLRLCVERGAGAVTLVAAHGKPVVFPTQVTSQRPVACPPAIGEVPPSWGDIVALPSLY